MIEAVYVVLTNAAPGRDADFNDWYTNVHARDTMRMRGGLAQQRFRFSAEQVQDFAEETGGPFPAQYLALYEVYDTQWFAQEHRDRARTPYMVIEDSLDMSRLDDFAYYPLAFRDRKPRAAAQCGVVLEQMQVCAGKAEAFREWYAGEYLPQRIAQPGIVSGALLAYEEYGQMMPFPPGHDHVAIWRVEDESARANWRGDAMLTACPFLETTKTMVSCWDIASARIFKDQVAFPDAAALAAEEAARARIKAQGSMIVDAKQRIKG